MQSASFLRTGNPRPQGSRLRTGALLLAFAVAGVGTPRAFAVSKEMVQLQTQVQQLQDAVARLQQSNDERMGVMKDLVQQTADSVNKMSLTVGQLQQQLSAQQEAQGAKVEQVSGQVQSLNDTLDELKARLQRMEKSIGDVQSSQQSMSARMEGGAAPAGSGGGFAPATTVPTTDVPAATPRTGNKVKTAPPPGFPDDTTPESNAGGTPRASATPTDAAGAPPVADLYQTAYGDYNAAKFTLAKAEFNDVIRFYPDSNYAGNSYFYLGEMLFKSHEYGPATKQYDKVIEQFPGNPKIASAQLRKGQSLIATRQNEAGIRELRSLIQRFPNSPEAITARAKLVDVGAATSSRR